MKLLSGPTSPFARKCRIVAIEKSIVLEEVFTNPFDSDDLSSLNPLKMIPVLILEDETKILDSDVICRFLNDIGEGVSLYPDENNWNYMTRATLGHGLAEASVQLQLQKILPINEQSPPLMERMSQRISRTLKSLDNQIAELSECPIRIDTICAVIGIGHLELRHGSSWKDTYANLNRWYSSQLDRPSIASTHPKV
jgi:glutathione S-transferase